MAQIPHTFIDELLSRTDIVGVVEKFIPLRKAGNNYVACCPFHQEKTASFTVSPVKQIYHCFGCGVGGNAIGFLMEYEHLRFVEAVEILASQVDMEVPKKIVRGAQLSGSVQVYQFMEEVVRFYQLQLRKHPQSKQALDYLKNRGLSEEVIRKFNIGYAPSGWSHVLDQLGDNPEKRKQLLEMGMVIQEDKGSLYDRFRDRIMFPIRDRHGRTIAFGGRVFKGGQPKYLNSPETAIFRKGRELYGLYEVYTANPHLTKFLIVEGYMDVVTLHQYGINYAVATLGTATTAFHIERLFRLTSEVIFCFDGDLAGQKAAWRALEEILPVLRDEWQIKFVFLPEGKDPDSLIRQEGKEGFEARILQANTLSEFFFKHLKAQVDPRQMDGRARLANLTMSYLQKMPANIMREMLIRHLSSEIHLDVHQLNQYFNLKQEVLSEVITKASMNKPSMVRMAMMLLIQYPEFIQLIEEDLPQLIVPGMEWLNKLIDVLRKNPELSTGGILEYFRDDSAASVFMQLASETLSIPLEGLKTEFRAILDRLRQRALEEAIDQLMTKASLEGLDNTEKRKLQELLRLRRVAQNA
jgi:DNA primase